MSRTRVLSATALAGALVAAGLAAGPALADDALEWSDVPGYPQTVGDVTVTWETASSTTSPFNGSEMLDPMPVYRPDIANGSTEARYFGFGTDFTGQGDIDQLWLPDAWGAFADLDEDISYVTELFWEELSPGASLSTSAGAGGADSWYASGMPAWSGHTITIFELSEAPVNGVVPTATAIASITTPGRFVAADLSDGHVDNLSAVLGQRATVSSVSGAADIFRGLTSMIEASGLPAGETLELWVARDLNYAFFQILGGGLPVGAIKVGEGTVAADGTLAAPFTLPLDLGWEPGETEVNYQLVAGVRAERYWPAGSYDDFKVKPAPNEASASSGAGASTVAIDLPTLLGPTQVQVAYPDGTTAGTTTAIVSATGPAPSGFTIASDPPLYLHLSTTATLGGPAEVCIAYDENTVTGDPPRLFHFDAVTAAWDDITTSSEPGMVCGVTSSFSPFALGHPAAEIFDFSGFFPPVSMDEENIAKAGQAIPVKFSLGGDRGLEVIASAQFVNEGTATSFDGEILDAVSAGGSGLSYSAADDRYTYVWKTSKAMAKKTGTFVLTLSDGTTHEFDVTFRK